MIPFKEFREERPKKSNNNSSDNKTAQWAVGENIHKAQEPQRIGSLHTVWVDPKDLVDHQHYAFKVSNKTDRNHIPGRYQKAIEHFKSGEFMDPPIGGYSHDDSCPVSIDNGRHRIAAAVELGFKYIPVQTTKESIKAWKKHFKVHNKQPSQSTTLTSQLTSHKKG